MSETSTIVNRNDHTGVDSLDLDHPLLHPTVAARENLREDAPPTPSGQRSNRIAQIRPASVRRSSSFSSSGREVQGSTTTSSEAGTKRPDSRARPISLELRSGLAVPVTGDTSATQTNKSVTEFRVGLAQKPFSVDTALLVSMSPYFAKLQKPDNVTTTNALQPNARLSGPFSFPEVDEFAFALFVRWIYGGSLNGPSEFRSMTHYLCLYVLAQEYQIEELENSVMDLVRHYYHNENMTSPVFRLEYIYGATKGPCSMRDFLVTTAAFRALSDQEEQSAGVSKTLKLLLAKGGDVSPDFATACCKLSKNDMEDVRKGDDCVWHVHNTTPKCPPARALEPWEKPE